MPDAQAGFVDGCIARRSGRPARTVRRRELGSPTGRSRTLDHAGWAQTRIARGELADEISALKREPGKDLLAWGGAAFAQSLSKLGLVDEYRLIL
ncbi:MAG: dihydrofolate reductase family protein [Solirubrobacteraceae bacterium]